MLVKHFFGLLLVTKYLQHAHIGTSCQKLPSRSQQKWPNNFQSFKIPRYIFTKMLPIAHHILWQPRATLYTHRLTPHFPTTISVRFSNCTLFLGIKTRYLVLFLYQKYSLTNEVCRMPINKEIKNSIQI